MPVKLHPAKPALAAFCLLLNACVSYEPARLVPAVTLSPEQVVLFEGAGNAGVRVDFGMEVGRNESDSLFNVEILPGIRVRSVSSNGAAAAAGIQVGDVILSIDGMTTDHPDTLLALQQQTSRETEFRLNVQRNTTVFEATLIARPVGGNAPPRELYRVDPLATRAGYRTELVAIEGRGDVAAARVTELFPDSTLPAAGIAVGDLVLALDGRYLNSAQDLITRLNRDYELGDRVQFSVYDGAGVSDRVVETWDPGRRISRISLWPLLRYESSLSPSSSRLSVLDFWLFALYSYSRVEGEQSHSLLGLFNFTSDYGELLEEQD